MTKKHIIKTQLSAKLRSLSDLQGKNHKICKNKNRKTKEWYHRMLKSFNKIMRYNISFFFFFFLPDFHRDDRVESVDFNWKSCVKNEKLSSKIRQRMCEYFQQIKRKKLI